MQTPSQYEHLDFGLSRLKHLAPAGYALGLHIRFASAHIMIQTYDPDWIEIYTRNGYMMCDPMVSWGFGNEGTCRWSAIDYPDPHQVFRQAAEHGLKYGVVVSCGELASRSIGGFARSDREFNNSEIAELERDLQLLHERSAPPKALTEAQRMALRMIAQGCRYTEAAARLNISESALKARLKSVRERLFVRTTAEAIQRAQEYKLL